MIPRYPKEAPVWLVGRIFFSPATNK